MLSTLRCSMRRLSLILVFGIGSAIAAEQPLPPDEAFKFSATLKGNDTVVARIILAKGHYLYKSKTRFALNNASGVMLKEIQMPAGEMKNDPFFGMIEVYKVPITVTLPLERSPKAEGLTLLATYQGCNEKLGICYPPTEKTVDLKFTR